MFERDTSRRIENWLAVAGIVQAVLYGLAEAAARQGLYIGDEPPDASFPWITLIIFAGCVLPKTVGRATAGKVWLKGVESVGAAGKGASGLIKALTPKGGTQAPPPSDASTDDKEEEIPPGGGKATDG